MTGFFDWVSDVGANISIPFELKEVFGAVSAVWDAFPFAVQCVLTCMFGLVCFFAIVKMLL